jgi:CheY-like chemotaxis protein
VEDNLINALLMQAVFEASPEFQLAVVDSGERACQAVRHACPDVLLLDMHLPDMGGIELLTKLRAECGVAHVPAIAVSADAMPDDLREAREAGFADYWTKPLDVTRIAPTLRALLAARVTAGGTMLV